ncbi:MAG: tRNA pseudouridine(55) synthase TruB [Spirochaetes bacterium]|nr:tRNA pseudouridine(55) synthase TruB [Spirochaetota bacterium]
MLNKKPGLTSFDALGEVKRALGTGKVGHTGTLDKFAQGLLAVLAGKALKLSRWFSDQSKEYVGTVCFGSETDTLDPEGSVVFHAPPPQREDVLQALGSFTGKIMQEPPAYSAIHINGQRASELSRKGQAPLMKKRPVEIYSLELLSWEPPFARLFVRCSSGTYIRSLARDLALAAGSRAHLTGLLRSRVGGFSVDDAWSAGAGEGTLPALRPIDRHVIRALGLPFFEVSAKDAEKMLCGKALAPILDGLPAAPDGDFSAAVFLEEALVAMVEREGGRWKYGCVADSLRGF